MATSWCPECRSEYREGFTECADCGVALVPELPKSPGRNRSRVAPTHSFGPDDVSVELVNLSAVEAELVAAQLNAQGIPAEVTGVGTAGELVALQFAQGSRVMVRRADLAAARAVLADLSVTGAAGDGFDDESLDAQAEAAAGWSDPETGSVV